MKPVISTFRHADEFRAHAGGNNETRQTVWVRSGGEGFARFEYPGTPVRILDAIVWPAAVITVWSEHDGDDCTDYFFINQLES
jgi:hypothetical protein